jgi:signal transduction histidine kinase
MLIRQQFRFAFGAVALAIAAALGVLLLMNARVARIELLRSWSNEIVRHVFDCNLLGSESILQDNARSREQYAAASAGLQALIEAPPEPELVRRHLPEIAAAKARLDQLFRESSRPPTSAPLEREDFEVHAMLVSQWMLQTRGLLETARTLRSSAAAESTRVRGVAVWASAGAIVLVGLIAGAIFLRSYKILVRPLHLLSAGARRIGQGDLSARLPADTRNEIGLVAESFNVMTEQLAAREAELQEKLRDLDAFSYSVAHDLKAPLRSMVGYGSLLEADYADRLGVEGQDFLRRMRESGLQMSALIDDLLEFGQLTHRRVDMKPVPLQPLCEQLFSEMHEEIARQNAAVSYNGDSPVLLANELLLKQILRNLISNAIKFVPEKTDPRVRIIATKNGTMTRVEVQDNGIGIAPEHQGKIFGLFQRLHSPKDFPGTGVGLALVQKSVERQRGRLGVSSAPGQGSTFWFQLPHQR